MQIPNIQLGGGFKYVLFSPLFGEDSHFDWYFSDGLFLNLRALINMLGIVYIQVILIIYIYNISIVCCVVPTTNRRHENPSESESNVPAAMGWSFPQFQVIYSNPVAMRATPKATGRLVGQLHPGRHEGWVMTFFWGGVYMESRPQTCDVIWKTSRNDSQGFLSNISWKIPRYQDVDSGCDNSHCSRGDVAYCNEKQRSGDWLKVEEVQTEFQICWGDSSKQNGNQLGLRPFWWEGNPKQPSGMCFWNPGNLMG